MLPILFFIFSFFFPCDRKVSDISVSSAIVVRKACYWKGELFALWQRSQLMTGTCEKYPPSQSGSPSVLVLHLQWWQGEMQVREGLCACVCRLVLCPCTFPGSTAVLDMLEGTSLRSPFSTHHAWCLNLSKLSLNLLILSASTASCGSKVYKFSACCPKKHFYLFGLSPTGFIKWPHHSRVAGFARWQLIYCFCDFVNCNPTFPQASPIQAQGSQFGFFLVHKLCVCIQLGHLCSVREHNMYRWSSALWCWTVLR